ncbi:MAG: ParB/RepB/Spo0J family partition protein, partial [Eubacteriales bacterium]
MSKKGLGRGLGALITETETDGTVIKQISLSDISPNPYQPRRDFAEEKLTELSNSIIEHGLIQPILVKPDGNKYIIIAGERRYRACKMAGFKVISCIIKNCDNQEMTEKALIENIQRDDLSPVDEGLAYAQLMKDYGLTQEQVAKRVGKGRATIANLLRLIQLPDKVLALLNNEEISLGHAKVLLGISDPLKQIEYAKIISLKKLSVRETEVLIHT